MILVAASLAPLTSTLRAAQSAWDRAMAEADGASEASMEVVEAARAATEVAGDAYLASARPFLVATFRVLWGV
jgi:hypothetical protein